MDYYVPPGSSVLDASLATHHAYRDRMPATTPYFVLSYSTLPTSYLFLEIIAHYWHSYYQFVIFILRPTLVPWDKRTHSNYKIHKSTNNYQTDYNKCSRVAKLPPTGYYQMYVTVPNQQKVSPNKPIGL